MRRLGFFALVVALVSFAKTSHADLEDLRVQFVAPKGCPGTNEFLEAVRARVPAGPHANVSFAVEIKHDAKGFLAKLTSVDDDRVIREVRAPICADAVNALALAAATALLPSEDAPATARLHPPIALDTVYVEGEPPSPPPDPILFSAGIGPMVVAGYGPVPSYGAQLYAQIAVGAAEVRVGGVFALSPQVTLGEGTSSDRISFSWQGARFDLCPYSFSLGKDGFWQIAPCVRMEMGAIVSNPSADTKNSEGDTRGWFALGGSVHATWAFRPPFFVESEVWASGPFVRDRFYLLPDVEVFEVPPVTGGVTISCGFFFSRRK